MKMKKALAIVLCLMLVLSCAPVFAAEQVSDTDSEWSGMTVSAADGTVAIRTSYSDTEDFVQRLINVFNTNSDPSRTNNYPVDFSLSHLVGKEEGIWEGTKTVYGTTSGDECPPIFINESWMGANHGHNSGVCVTIANHGLAYSDIGSRWIGSGTYNGTSSDEVVWNLLRIDGDKLTFLSDDKGAERGLSYTFWNGVANDVLTREDDASQTLTFPSSVSNGNQLKPSIRNSSVNAYGISKGVIIELEDGQTFDCDEFIIEESYEVVDPSTIAQAIRDNAPAGGYISNPDIAFGGDVLFNYNITYTFRKDGTMLQEVDHEIVKAMRIGHTPMVMHKMRENFTGGDIFRYIPNTTEFQTKDKDGTENVTYNFSIPSKIFSKDGEAVKYPNNYVMKGTECVDTTYPTERYIEYYTDAEDNFAATYAEGILPIGYASKETWEESTKNGVFYFYNSLKSYPHTYQKYAQPAGSRLNAVSYKKYVPAPEGSDGKTRSYSIAYEDTLYTYVDMFESGQSFTLPEGYEIVNKSANVEVAENVATAAFASGDTHAYIAVSSAYDDGIGGVSKEEALSMVAFEKLCTEPMSKITKDISLPSTAAGGDVTITWNTSDKDVIEIVDSKAVVKRDLAKEKNVTLTATVTDSEGSTPVQYKLTVLPQIYNVYKVQNFYFPDDTDAAMTGSFINTSDATAKAVAQDADGSYYAAFDFATSGLASGRSVSASLYDGNNKYGTVYLFANIKTSGTSTHGIDVRTTIRNKNGSDLGKSITIARIKNNVVYTNTGSNNAGSLSTTDFTPVILKVDIATGSGAIKVGSGNWVTMNSFADSYTYSEGDFLGALNFYRAASSAPENTLMISEACAYNELSVSDKLAELSDAEKVAFFSGLITPESITAESKDAITEDLTLTNSYKDYDLTALGVSIDWKSSNTSYVSDNGIVTPSQAPNVPVTMTATITAGEVSETKTVDITLVPKNSAIIDNTVLNQKFDGKTLGTVPSADFTFRNNNGAVAGVQYITDADTNSTVLHLQNEDNDKAVYLDNSKIYGLTYNGRYFVSFDYKYERADKTGDGAGASAFVGTFGLAGQLQTIAQFNFNNRTVVFTSYDTTGKGLYTHEYPMPESMIEGKWSKVTIDYQPVSRSYQVYVNGELVNDVPAILAHAEEYGKASPNFVHALRGLQLGCSQNGDLYVDNFVTRQATNSDEINANAAKNVGLMQAAGDYENILMGTINLNSAGPASNGQASDTNNLANLSLTGTSTISYMVDGASASSITVDKMGTKTITVTGTSNGVTDTSSAVRRTATFAITSVVVGADNKPVITLKGNYSGKSLLAAVYEGSKLVGITTVNANADSVTADIKVADGQNVRVFALGENANPLAYAK